MSVSVGAELTREALDRQAAKRTNGAKLDTTHGVVPRSLQGTTFSDMRPHLASGYVIKGLLGSNALATIFGPSGCGKTFFATDMAVHIASGKRWRAHKVRGGLVVYVALEGATSAENRFCAARGVLGFESSIPLVMTAGPLNLREAADAQALVEFVRGAESEHGTKVTATFIDTLSRAMAGGDENGPEDMGALVAGADAVRLATGSTVILVHHTGKDGSRGARGHSSLKAALDTEIEVDTAGTVHVATVVKQRDLASGGKFAFTLEVVELGNDDEGDAVTTCVVREADSPEPTRKAPTGKNQAALLAALQEWQRCHPDARHINSLDYRAIAKTQGISAKRLPEVTDTLTKLGWLGPAVGGYSLFPEAA